MNDTKQKINTLFDDFQAVFDSLEIDKQKEELSKLEAVATDPNLWDDQEKARGTLQNIQTVKSEIEEAEEMKQNITTLKELANENLADNLEEDLEKFEKRLKALKLRTFLSGAHDKNNAIVSIHAGQGGTEAMDWAGMLHRMYLRYCEKKNWKVQGIDYSEGEEAGIKSVAFRVESPYAYGYLKNESGTHRLVRQSPFNADNLRQTSFAMVEVLPELEEMDLKDVEIKDEDLEWQFFRAGGHGGQNVNKVSTAVRVKHIPTGLVVSAQTERVQEQNRKNALALLRAKVWALEQEKEEKKLQSIKGEYTPASWGTQIRSYVLHPYKMVKDLRTDFESPNPDAVLDGDLDGFITAQLEKFVNRHENR